MLTKLYPYLTLLILFSTIIWFYYKSRERRTIVPNIIFFGSLFLYLPVVLFSGAPFYKMLFVFIKDLITFLILMLIANNLYKKSAFLTLSFILGAISYFFYFDFLKHTFEANVYSVKDSHTELILMVDDAQALKKIKKQLRKDHIEIKKAFPYTKHKDYAKLDYYFTISIPESRKYELEQKINDLIGSRHFVEINESIQINIIEEDATEKKDEILKEVSSDILWGAEKLGIDELHQYLMRKQVKPEKFAKVAILDAGVDGKSESLRANYFSIHKKYDRDRIGHGTLCANIITSVANHPDHDAEIAYDPFVKVTSIKVLCDKGTGSQQSVINGIVKAADAGSDVISISFNGQNTDSDQQAYSDAIHYANKSGAIVVVSAGNNHTNANKFSPANCKNVIVVTAVDDDLNRESSANDVSELAMGIAAPGKNILFDDHKIMSSTSMAAPYVAGIVGLMKSLEPRLSTEEIYHILRETGLNTNHTEKTGKLIQPYAAIHRLLEEQD